MKYFGRVQNLSIVPFFFMSRILENEFIVGVDEVGRGCLAGPVVGCAVMFLSPHKIFVRSLKNNMPVLLGDSKKLTSLQREKVFEVITRISYVRFATASVYPSKIDRINIGRASALACAKAVKKLSVQPSYVFVDGIVHLPLRMEQEILPQADEKILECSLASIIAKVTRDRMMTQYHKKYPQYGFDVHKGYGTKLHYAMLHRFGPSPIHRKSFRLK